MSKMPARPGFRPALQRFSDWSGSSRLGPIRRDSGGFGQQMQLGAEWI